MDVKREQAFVNQYHFDARNFEWEKEHGTPETTFRSDFRIVERDAANQTTTILSIFHFMIVFDYVVISGVLSQASHVQHQVIEDAGILTDEQKRFLNEPLVDMLKRLTYDVTEIAFDAPGIQLELH